MLLIIEILLTVSVWKSGWKGWALLPVGICFVLGIFFGCVTQTVGASGEEMLAPYLMLDLLAIVILVIMKTKSPKSSPGNINVTGEKAIVSLEK